MNGANSGPSADSITVAETLDLLEGPFEPLAQGLADDGYALWLGSGISRARLPGLDQLVLKVLEFLHDHLQPGDSECSHRRALEKAVGLVDLRPDERSAIDFDDSPASWPALRYIVEGLVSRYQDLLAIRVSDKDDDYLVWEAVDVRGTYGGGLEPDCEHLCLGILMLEGAVSEVVSANWDGLIEAALTELGSDPEGVLQIVVLPEELRGSGQDVLLLKFHGCAVLASRDPTKYRDAIIATRPQITEWNTRQDLKSIRDQMVLLASTKRTLMIGLSARDENVQRVFAQADEDLEWKWPDTCPAHVFADDVLGEDHTNILQVVYREDYGTNADDIEKQALIRAYGKPLLTALVLVVIAAKLRAFLLEADAPGLSAADREELIAGLNRLPRRLALEADPDPLGFIRKLIAGQRRILSLFRDGIEPPTGAVPYVRVANLTPASIKSDSGLTTGGMRELAAGLALLGRGEAAGTWSLKVGPSSGGAAGALTVRSGGRETAVFFAANSQAALHLYDESITEASAGDAVIIHSTEPVKVAVRSPRGHYGRNGHPASREVDMFELLKTSTDLAALEADFRQAAAL